MGVLWDAWELLTGPTWGTVRLPGGRGVFYPYGLSRLAYEVPSEELYRRISRYFMAYVCAAVLLFFAAVAAGTILNVRGADVYTCLFAGIVALFILVCIGVYFRWARRITRNLGPYSGEDLDFVNAPTLQESLQRNVLWFTPFSLYGLCFVFLLVMALGFLVLLTHPEELWVALAMIAAGGSACAWLLYLLRIKARSAGLSGRS